MARPEKKMEELRTRLIEVNDLNRANDILSWDQQTYMPPGGAEARGRQEGEKRFGPGRQDGCGAEHHAAQHEGEHHLVGELTFGIEKDARGAPSGGG